MCVAPPHHPTRARKRDGGTEGGWGGQHGEKGYIRWAEQLPIFYPLLNFSFFNACAAPLALYFALPMFTTDPRAQPQNMLTLLSGFVGVQILSLVIFAMWATRDQNYRAATRFVRPVWREEEWDWGALSRWARLLRAKITKLRKQCWSATLAKVSKKRTFSLPSPDADPVFDVNGTVLATNNVVESQKPAKLDQTHSVSYLLDIAPESGSISTAVGNPSASQRVAMATVSRTTMGQAFASQTLGSRQKITAGVVRSIGTEIFSRCRIKSIGEREAIYVLADFLQFNAFCFLNHATCWQQAPFLGRTLARMCTLSHLQLSGSFQVAGSIFGWMLALVLVALFTLGSEVLTTSLFVKFKTMYHCCHLKSRRFLSVPPAQLEASDEETSALPVAQRQRRRQLQQDEQDGAENDDASPKHRHALGNDHRLAQFAQDAGLPLNPAKTPSESDIVRVFRMARCAAVWLLSHRSLLIFIGSVGLMPIASQLLVALACDYPADPGRPWSPPAHPQISQSLICWDDSHRVYILGSLIGMGIFVPLSMLMTPLLGAAARPASTTPLAAATTTTVAADCVQWAPGYNAARTLAKLLLLTLLFLMPEAPAALDVGVFVVCFCLAWIAILSQPCSIHAVLKLHVVTLASACCTATASIRYRLYRGTESTGTGTEVKTCAADSSDAFWMMQLMWCGLLGLSLTFRYWYGTINTLWTQLVSWRENQRRMRPFA
eukprot:COSAG05_NODE_582_length_8540_cov_26.722782_4_plen_718_part_00